MITLIIDKHPIVRKGLSLILKGHFKEDAILASANMAILQENFSDFHPDLIILGVSQQTDISNANFIRAAETQYPGSAIIVNDQVQDTDQASLYLRSGASAYMSKESDIEELLVCIGQVMAGRQYVTETPRKFKVGINQAGIKYKGMPELHTLLASREYEIAHYLSQGFRTGEIANLLGKKASTISTQKQKIYQKLNVDNIIKLREALIDLEISGVEHYKPTIKRGHGK